LDLKKVYLILVPLLLIGIIFNFFFFQLGSGELFKVYLWIGVLFSCSLIGAKIFTHTKQESLIPFSLGIGLLLCSWISWIIFHFVPINLFLPVLIVAGIYSLIRLDQSILKELLIYNSCFLVIFWVLLILNSFHPEIYWGEKPMDFNLLNFLGRNTAFPPEDPWLWGEKLKYYYFGYFMYGKLGSLLSLEGASSFHLSLATTAGLFFLGAISLLKSLKHKLIPSILGGLLLLSATSIGSWLGYFIDGKKGINAFWASTRVFKNNGFSEYPFWSFIFGDLHPHVMAYPFSLFGFVLLLRIVLGEKRNLFSISTLLLGFLIASLGALNSWDIIYLAFFFTMIAVFQGPSFIKDQLKKPVIPLALILGGLLWLPMIISLKGGKAAKFFLYGGEHNTIINYFVHQGLWWLLIALFMLLLYINNIKKPRYLYSILAAFFVTILVTENFVFLDRMNTIFKFGNQLFISLGVIAMLLYKDLKKFNIVSLIFLGIFILSAGFDQHNVTKYNAFGSGRPTLKGTKYLTIVAKGDLPIINYLNQNIVGTPLLLETPGKSFENNRARISMHTGIPTYLGWDGHVITRGASPREAFRRFKEVDALYESKDALKSFEWLKERGIQYVVVGGAEHAKYRPLGLAKFKQYVDLFVPLVQTKIGNKVFALYKVGN
tara:strand:+ start:146908 stop:148884 length:1977 start_codon:yes stop_codon:yes gene_type:complete